MHRLCLLITWLLTVIFLRPVIAQIPEEIPAEPDEPEYLVEFIVFQYRDGGQGTEEQWSAKPPEHSEEDLLLTAEDGDETALDEELLLLEEEEPTPEELTAEEMLDLPTPADLIPVPRSAFQLLDIASRLASSRNHEPLVHAGWKQQGYPVDIAPAYEVQTELGQANLSGSLTFSKGRYLRLDVDIEYRPYGAAFPPADRQPYDPYGPIAPYSPVFYITENRRGMRSNEIHFFDHPQFGLLAKITPIPAPESETEAQTETKTETETETEESISEQGTEE